MIQELYRATRGQAIIVADVGQHQMFAAQHYLYDEPYSYITSGGLGTMGYSLPAAIGAQMARPDKQVWCVVGDGCFQMTLQELAVAALHRVPVKIALLNNGYLGMVRQQQEVQYRGNLVEVDLGWRPGLRQAGAGVRHSGVARDRARAGGGSDRRGDGVPRSGHHRVPGRAHRGRLPVGAGRHLAGRSLARTRRIPQLTTSPDSPRV